MDKKPLRIVCPTCKAEPDQPCKSSEGHYMKLFHHQRYQRPSLEDVNQAAAQSVREAAEKN